MATEKTMAVAITTTAILPVGRKPEDDGWKIETGGLNVNLWKRVQMVEIEDLPTETLADLADTITSEMKTRILANELKVRLMADEMKAARNKRAIGFLKKNRD